MKAVFSLFAQESVTAADWWMKHLCRSGNEIQLQVDRPIDSDALAKVERLVEVATGIGGVRPEQKTAFRGRLGELIQERLIHGKGYLCISSEPEADDLLVQAAEKVGIPVHEGSTFPPHSTVWIEPGKVEAKHGFTGRRHKLRLLHPAANK